MSASRIRSLVTVALRGRAPPPDQRCNENEKPRAMFCTRFCIRTPFRLKEIPEKGREGRMIITFVNPQPDRVVRQIFLCTGSSIRREPNS